MRKFPVAKLPIAIKRPSYNPYMQKNITVEDFTEHKVPLNKYFDVNPFSEASTGAISQKAIEHAHLHLSSNQYSPAHISASNSSQLIKLTYSPSN